MSINRWLLFKQKLFVKEQQIEFYNRYSSQIEIEEIYGEKWLKFIYNNSFGKFLLWLIVKRTVFSYLYGRWAKSKLSIKEIIPFIEKYKLNENEFILKSNQFTSFNDFFIRKLKPESRPIDEAVNSVIFPADGRHLGFQNINPENNFYVKDQQLDLIKLLGSYKLADQFKNGSMVFSRLCPIDYHRFHFPYSGIVKYAKLINGPLFSVSPLALKQNLKILSENKRCLTLLEINNNFNVAIVEVGATNVGSIVQTHNSNTRIIKGDEKGYFQFGGSAIITLFPEGKIRLADDLVAHSESGREIFARMGDKLGEWIT